MDKSYFIITPLILALFAPFISTSVLLFKGGILTMFLMMMTVGLFGYYSQKKAETRL